MSSILANQYCVEDFPGLLLSPRSYRDGENFECCSSCYSSLMPSKAKDASTKSPNYTIANGFAIVHIPSDLMIGAQTTFPCKQRHSLMGQFFLRDGPISYWRSDKSLSIDGCRWSHTLCLCMKIYTQAKGNSSNTSSIELKTTHWFDDLIHSQLRV